MSTVTINSNQPVHRVPLGEKMRVWFHNLKAKPFQLARWYMARCLRNDPSLYISYHANIACRLMDLQSRHGFGTDELGNHPTHSNLPFNFQEPDHRNAVAEDLLRLIFDLPTDTHDKAYSN